MTAHAIEYVRVRNAGGTLQRNLPEVGGALARREAEGFALTSTVPDTQNGDLVGILLLFARAAEH
jgi:hypothetical protein